MLTYLKVRRQLDERGRRRTSRSQTAMLTNSLRKSWCNYLMHAQHIGSTIGKRNRGFQSNTCKTNSTSFFFVFFLFQETGIAVLQFARGDELKMLQEEAVDRATRLPKITIHNETEVIQSVPTANEMGGVTHPWTTVAIDCARMQSYLPKGESMPGTAFIEVLPTYADFSQEDEKGAVAHEVLICQMLLRQRSNCTGISNQEARVTLRSCWVRCWSHCGRQGSSSIPCHTGGIRW